MSEDTAVAEPEAAGSVPEAGQPNRVANLLWAIKFSAAAAVVLNTVLDLSVLVTSGPRFWRYNFLSISFVADTFLVWLVLIALVAITNRVVFSVGVLGAFVVLIAVANRIKLNLRLEPIYPSDIDFIREPGFLSTMVSPSFIIGVVISLLALVGGAAYLSRKEERALPRLWSKEVPTGRRVGSAALRLGVVVVSAALLVSTASFNHPGNPWKSIYEFGTPGWRPWNQRTNYAAHGFIGGFLYNMPAKAMSEPKGYSRATMDALAAKYQAEADRINATRTGSLDDTNVVIVLSESFSDPTRLKGFELAEDPIPKTRALLDQTTSGTMMAQLYGGGTANMEFEVLTGQSVGLFAPQMNSPYQMLVSNEDRYPSAVGWFAAHGHEPIAIHPYMTGMYKRKSVYKTFGFDDFIHDSTMKEHDRIDHSDFISDQSAFDEVERQIEATEKPLMVNLVTMQNHIPMNDTYDDPMKVSGLSGKDARKVGNYARGLAHTDDALAEFLEDLKASDEKTVVIFYGDHLPGIYSGKVKSDNPGGTMYQTPFFVWSNRGTNPVKQLPLTSPNHFLPILYEAVGAPVPPYFAMLQSLYGQVSALEQGRIMLPDGTKVSSKDLSPAARQALDDARMVQYDFSIGKRYAVATMWPGALG
ncbi:phosphoglycerol transferase MdoB-like AlkP superfamily enzyme [Marmoricola sp. OAE513]|uniref:LTA synthase family protein n=1 Tax=Marmoricola sp. OAE513 TaxID=2817894 RepID=UPI001AEB8320